MRVEASFEASKQAGCRAGLSSHMLPLQAGAQRLSALANLSHSGASAAIDGEAIPKLLHLLEHSDDQGTILLKALRLHRSVAADPNEHHFAVAF